MESVAMNNSFTYEMSRPHAVIQDACHGIVNKILEDTKINPFIGKAS